MLLPAKMVLTLPWFLARARWQRARFDPHAEYEIVVAPGPAGRPGERLVAPTPSLWKAKVVPGARNDFSVFLDREGSTLQAVCHDDALDQVDPERSARETLQHFWEKGWVALKPIAADEIGGAEAFRYHVPLPTGSALTEWKIAHDGWLYSVGVLARASDEAPTIRRARRALDTWQWLSAS